MAKLRFRFDKRIPEEAALLDHLRSLPEDRHIEYVRNLALKAFRQEHAESCRPNTGVNPPASGGGDEKRGIPRPNQAEPKSRPFETQRSQNKEPVGEVSLASLKHLVG